MLRFWRGVWVRACHFRTAPRAIPAFCDTFDHPMGTGNRSGELNGLVWGVSRATSNNNPPQGLLYTWAAVRRSTCGRVEGVRPEHDVAICNGHAVEAINDNGGVTVLAMYPRQPFDFAGRTAIVEFDVSDNSQGPHVAWPAFLITDQPVPAPYQTAAGRAEATYVSETAAMPVPLADLRNGANALQLRISDPAGVAIANVDPILREPAPHLSDWVCDRCEGRCSTRG